MAAVCPTCGADEVSGCYCALEQTRQESEARIFDATKALVEKLHAELYPDGCPSGCEACRRRLQYAAYLESVRQGVEVR